MHHPKYLLPISLLLALLLPLWAGAIVAGPAMPSDADIDAAMQRGLDWLARHPASVDDGGLPDILDEGVGYYVRYNLAVDAAGRAGAAAQLRDHMTRLGDLPEFQQWVYQGRKKLTDYYHLVLAAHLMQVAGEPHELQGEIAAQARRVLRMVQRCDPTKRLAIALFLQHQGEQPGIVLQAALAGSRIERIVRGNPPRLPPQPVPAQVHNSASLELYALVHEIVALTDFGRRTPPPWLQQRRAAVSRFLGQAVSWATTAGNIDLAAELLMSVRLLQEPLTDPCREAVAVMVASQQEDGGWGDATPGRMNKQRHAVLTATTALWVYRHAAAPLPADEGVL